MSKKNEIAVNENTSMELANLRNEFAGSVEVRQDVIKTARLKLTQKMSKSTDSGLGKPGEFVCEAHKTNYGNSIKIIPLVVTESASLLYSTQKPPRIMPQGASFNEGQVLCRTNDMIKNNDGVQCQECPWGEFWNDWGSKANKVTPACKKSIDVVCLVYGQNEPVTINFRKTSYKAGAELVNLIIRDKIGVPFGSVYTLNSVHGNENGFSYEYINNSNIESSPLSNDQISKIIPIAKNVLEAKKKGILTQEQDEETHDDEATPY